MPLIVYKTLTIGVHYAQTRRINCEMCREPFVLVYGGGVATQSTGLPLLSSDDGMRREAARGVIGKLNAAARRPRMGIAACPHCGRPQSWMLGRVYVGSIAGWSIGLGLAAAVIGAIASAVADVASEASFMGWVLTAGVLGALAGAAIGYWRGRRQFVAPGQQDGRSMTDEQFKGLVAACEAQDADHALTWYFNLGNSPPGGKTMLVSLGFMDQAGGLEVPESITTEYILREMAS